MPAQLRWFLIIAACIVGGTINVLVLCLGPDWHVGNVLESRTVCCGWAWKIGDEKTKFCNDWRRTFYVWKWKVGEFHFHTRDKLTGAEIEERRGADQYVAAENRQRARTGSKPLPSAKWVYKSWMVK